MAIMNTLKIYLKRASYCLVLCFFTSATAQVSTPLASAQTWFNATQHARMYDQLPSAIHIDSQRQTIWYVKANADGVHDLWLYRIDDQTHRPVLRASTFATRQAPQPTAGQQQLEQAERERQRDSRRGITAFDVHPNQALVLINWRGQLYLYDLSSKAEPSALLPAAMNARYAEFSPRGNYISFVHNHNLYTLTLADQQLRQHTQSIANHQQFATPEFIAQEEMGRQRGYWWSPDERFIALTEVDERPIPPLNLAGITSPHALQSQRYPRAGQANAKVRLGILRLADQQLDWFDLDRLGDGYLARVKWLPDSQHLSYQWQSRDQKSLQLWLAPVTERLQDNSFAPLATVPHRQLLEETSATWVDLHHNLRFLDDRRHFIWTSTRSGYAHIYLYRTDGSLIRQLSAGDWQVDSVVHVDEASGVVYFTAREQGPLERHLYRISLTTSSPTQPTRLSGSSGVHDVQFSADGRFYLNQFSSPRQPPQLSLHGPTGQRIGWLHEAPAAEHPWVLQGYQWQQPEYGSFTSATGATLTYQLTQPANFNPNQRYPALVIAYGGPRAQRVWQAWGAFEDQYWAQRGYFVLRVDGRGAGGRGVNATQALYHRLGTREVDDQLAAVDWLAQQPYVDAKRIGMYGHSYGGYLSLLASLRSDHGLAAIAAGAPVTDWQLYDTHYTERYLGTPANERMLYQRSSVLQQLANRPLSEPLSAPLLVYHGLADDNVHFLHTSKLLSVLQQRQQPFELMVYPHQGHLFTGTDANAHRMQLLTDFFARHLQNPN